jgi:uncharacterized RDD family membrane protein YckC
MTQDETSRQVEGAAAPAPYPPYPPAPYPPAPYPPAPYPPPASWNPGIVAYSLPTAPPGPAPGVLWATVTQRLGALALDVGIAIGTLILVAVLITALGTRSVYGVETATPTGVAIDWLWLLFMFLYHPFCWWRFGATPGQKAAGLRVVRESDGRPLKLRAVALRYALFFTLTVTVVPGIVAGLAAASEPRKRAWHDEASGSVVIKPQKSAW